MIDLKVLRDWCAAQDAPAVLNRATVNAFIATVLESGAEEATARSRQLAVRRFSAWCVEEGETARDERDRPGTAQTFGRDLRAVVPQLRTLRPRDGESRERRYVSITLKS